MNKSIVLITGVGGDIGQSIIKCLKETGYNFYLLGCDIDLFAAGRKMVDKFYVTPPAREEERYLEFIKKLIDEQNIKYIFPVTEIEIEFFDRYRDYFGNKNIVIFINKSKVIKTFLDKFETVNFLKNNNLPYPRTYLLENYNNELQFPFFLKPRKGWGSKGLVIVNDLEEFNFLKKRMKHYLVQEIIGSQDEEYTVTVFSTGREIYSIAFKRYLGYGSLTKVAHLINDEAMHPLVEIIAKAADLEGSLNIQCRKKDATYIPFEINPRFSSTVYIRHYFGFQDVKWWIDLVERRSIKYIPKFKEGVAVRVISEFFFDLVSG